MGKCKGATGARLLPVAVPDAVVALIETQPPLPGLGVTVERYSTAHRVILEKHIYPNGHADWFKVVYPAKLPVGGESSATNGVETE